VEPREGKLRLGQGTGRGHHRYAAMLGSFLRSREQGGLADSGLAANNEGAATVLDSVDQRVELRQVSIASKEQPWCGSDSFGIWSRGAHAHPSWSRPSTTTSTCSDFQEFAYAESTRTGVRASESRVLTCTVAGRISLS
jgi:hypothetical protein